MPKNAALIEVVPCPIAVARPFGSRALNAATAALDDIHVTSAVISCFVPSEKVPSAVNCCEPPKAIVWPEGVIDIEARSGSVTVKKADPEALPKAAVITADPGEMAAASPALLIMAIPG